MIKKYEKRPKTPCERLLENAGLSAECKLALRRRQATLDPFTLAETVEKALKKVAELRRKLDLGEDEEGLPQRLFAVACVPAPLGPAARRSASTSATVKRRSCELTLTAAITLQ